MRVRFNQKETGVPGENHRPTASHWQTLSRNVVSNSLKKHSVPNLCRIWGEETGCWLIERERQTDRQTERESSNLWRIQYILNIHVIITILLYFYVEHRCIVWNKIFLWFPDLPLCLGVRKHRNPLSRGGGDIPANNYFLHVWSNIPTSVIF